MKKQLLSKISQYIGVAYKGFYILKKDKTKIAFSSSKNLNLKENENGLLLDGELDGYSFSLFFNKQSNGSVHFGMKLFGDRKDVRRIVPFCAEIPTAYDSQILVHDFIKSGIKSCKDKPKGISRYHLCIGKENGDSSLSIINEIPSKFYSEFLYSTRADKTKVEFATEFPYTYEGEYCSENAYLFLGIPATEAIEKSVENINEVPFEHPVGWSTWDYYFRDVSDECIKENVEFISNDKYLKENIKYIAIDDGWNQTDGDWIEGGRIKAGLKETVDYIKEKGFLAGIWTAPVRVEMLSGSAMRRIYPALIKNDYGDPLVYDAMYVLDPTHPIGERFILDIYERLSKCGFDFYKIDFLDYILHGDYFYDKYAGHYDVLRKLLALIRGCIGDDAHMMGCNMPYGVGGGIVQSRRTGLDIHNHWGHIVKCTEFYLPQFSSHARIYQNDLDYLVVRGPETGDDAEANNVTNPMYYYAKKNPPQGFAWRYGEDVTYEEAKTWATVVLMSGSSIFLGDRLSRLNECGLSLVKRTIKYADYVAAKPLDVLASPICEIWYKDDEQIFVFNWGEEEKQITVPVNKLFGIEHGVFFDVYTDEKYTAEQGVLRLKLPAHGSVALKGLK